MEKNPVMYELGQTHKLFKEEVRKEVIRNNVPITYFNILRYLNSHKEAEINQVDLCEFLGIKPSSVSVNLANMEREGLINRVKSSNDSRKTLVNLTPEGEKLLSKIRKSYHAVDEKISNYITKEEEEELRRILIKISNGLRGEV